MNAGALDSMSLGSVGLEPKKNSAMNAEPLQTQGNDFFSYLKDALQDVDQLQKDAAASAARVALGDQDYLHNTVIAYEKANLALQLTVEVRNRIVDAYQEIMRIQM